MWIKIIINCRIYEWVSIEILWIYNGKRIPSDTYPIIEFPSIKKVQKDTERRLVSAISILYKIRIRADQGDSCVYVASSKGKVTVPKHQNSDSSPKDEVNGVFKIAHFLQKQNKTNKKHT